MSDESGSSHHDHASFAIVGLTGNIASGKSTVSEMIETLGTPVLDADVIARDVVEPGRPAYRDIVERFGNDITDREGRLDREALGDIVFDNEEARADLDAITHPRIARRMRERADQLREAGHHWILYDAALLVENDLHRGLDSLVVVAAEREIRLERLMERDGLERDEARARFDTQMPQRDKIRVADYVIDNNGSLDETRRQVERLHELFERGLQQCGTTQRDVLVEQGFELPPRDEY